MGLSYDSPCPAGHMPGQQWRLCSRPAGDTAWREIVCPGLALLPQGHEETAALLPLTDLNGAALGYCRDRIRARDQVHGGALALMMSDPFLNPARIADTLRDAGVDTVFNWPSCQVLDGDTARAVASAGLGVAREVALIAEFTALGFQTLGLARGAGHGALMAGAGATQIVLHPGVSLRDWRSRAMSARLMEQEMRAASEQGLPFLVCRPRGYGSERDTLIARGAGVVSLGDRAA